MRDVNPAVIAALESNEITAFLLFSMTIDGQGYRYTDCDIPLPYAGNRYHPRGMEFSGARYSTNNIVDQVRVTVDDTDGELTPVFLAGGAQGSPAELSLVLLDNSALAAGSITIIGGAATPIFPGEIDDWDLQAERSVAITVTSPLAAWNRTFTTLHTSSCRWRRFKGGRCGYTGEETWCDRSYARCSELGNTDNFGGFRWLPSLENKEIWWGREGR